MDLIIALSLIILGFAILIIGGESLVKAAVSMASKLRIAPAIIGLTVIAAGTSAPELVTSLLAALRESPDIAMGNVIGSNIFNILVIIGLASAIKPNRVALSFVRIEIPVLIICSIILLILSWDLELSSLEGVSCVLVLCVLFYISIYRAKKVGYEPDGDIQELKNKWFDIGYLVFGCGALVGGAQIALEGGIQLGQIIGLSERIIGITIISIGTGLPELATSCVAAYRGRNDIAIANVIGSNLFNTMGVAGAASAIHAIKISPAIAHLDAPIMLAVTFLLLPIVTLGKMQINRATGFLMCTSYGGYILYLLSK